MGFFDSMKITINPRLDRTVFFPGNIMTGVVDIQVSSMAEFVGLRLVATGEEWLKVAYSEQEPYIDQQGQQRYRTVTRYVENSTIIYKQVVTLAGMMESGGMRQSQPLPQGNWSYPFQLQLPPNLPPTMFSDKSRLDCAIRYNLEVVVDIPMGLDSTQKIPFSVLSPIPATQWAMMAPKTEDKHFDITCCCCIDKGSVDVRFWMDRTVVALDRDEIKVYAGVDNTNGEEKVEQVNVSLVNHLRGRCHGRDGASTDTIASTQIKQIIEPGAKAELNGVIKLRPLANPTTCSLNILSTYALVAELEIAWATDPSCSFPIVVAHSVDETNFLPAKDFGGYYNFQPVYLPETYYTPPPVIPQGYQCNMMPIQAPANAQMWTPPTNVFETQPGAFFTG